MQNKKNHLKQNALLIYSVFLWLCLVGVLYYIEYVVFAGTLDSILIFAILLPPCVIIAEVFSKENKAYLNERPNTESFIIGLVLRFTTALFFAIAIYTKPYSLAVYQILAVCIIVVSLDFFKNYKRKLKLKYRYKERALFLSLIFMAISATPFVYSAIANVLPLSSAVSVVEQAGYIDAELLYISEDLDQLEGFFAHNLKADNNTNLNLNTYLFKASKDDTAYLLSVNVIGGEILGVGELRTSTT